ncbi:hypothetical protein OE88DRAFT_1642924 [Heliocybe sulcata]|uniref:Uncharacterized protein n=1 Tax=Heliocybe sulcata TaxID=5364 RepID=A0A5C3NAT7_9AGAM|nr:hypothetical protein OE88DRAFT_1642924 [Heliocybe sulcata]
MDSASKEKVLKAKGLCLVEIAIEPYHWITCMSTMEKCGCSALRQADQHKYEDISKDIPTEDADIAKANFNYIKGHSGTHAFDDFLAKGASCNSNTKPNEKVHQPLKEYYLLTNKKNVGDQDMDYWIEVNKPSDEDLQNEKTSELIGEVKNVYLGSK